MAKPTRDTTGARACLEALSKTNRANYNKFHVTERHYKAGTAYYRSTAPTLKLAAAQLSAPSSHADRPALQHTVVQTSVPAPLRMNSTLNLLLRHFRPRLQVTTN